MKMHLINNISTLSIKYHLPFLIVSRMNSFSATDIVNVVIDDDIIWDLELFALKIIIIGIGIGICYRVSL